MAAGKHLGRETVAILLTTNDLAVHVKQNDAQGRDGQNSVAVLALFGIIDSGAGGVDGWTSHNVPFSCVTANPKSLFIGIPDDASDYSRSLLHITAGSDGVDIRMSYEYDCNLFVLFGNSDDNEDDRIEVECT